MAKKPAPQKTAKKVAKKAAPKKSAPKKAAAKKAAPKAAPLKASSGVGVGAKAPAFSMASDSGATIKLADFKGKNVILYFYPKDDTPGCTTEACDFTAGLPNFGKANAVVIGVSKDSVASHAKFKAKYKLKHTLGADESGDVCAAYSTWVEKSMYGRKYMGIERSTFLIDATGIIRGAWRGVKVPGHAAEVLSALKAL